VVAPLGGLLGATVNRYDCNFPTNLLCCTGDPKIMAGVISSALITTVLGLVVAITNYLALLPLLSTQKQKNRDDFAKRGAGVDLLSVLERQSKTKGGPSYHVIGSLNSIETFT